MPKISQYTVVEPQGEDKIIITQTIGSPEDATKNITIDDLKEYINQGGGGNGVASLNTLTGNVTLVAGANVIIANDLNDTITISAPNIVDKTTDQTIDGIKTFEKPIFLDDIVTQGNTLKIEHVSGTFRVTRNNNNSFFGFQNSFFEFNNNNGQLAKFNTSLITGAREYFFPDANGTIALTSDIGTSTLQEVTANGSSTTLNIRLDGSALIYDDDTYLATLQQSASQSANITVALPQDSGTLALKSDIPTIDLQAATDNGSTTTNNIILSSSSLLFNDGTNDATIQNGTQAGDITLTLPTSTGTLALTSDLSSLSADQEIADFNATIDQVGVMVDVNSATDVVVTVRDFATEAIPVGSVLTYRQAGVGKISNAYSVATGDTSTTYREGDVLTLWQKTQDNWVVINPPHAIDSQTAGEPTGSDQVLNVVSLTQAEYDAAVGSHNADTLYVITS